MTDVTVIGLGQMGAAIARLLLRAGRSVTVWNRSAERAAPLEAEGAARAGDPAAAIAASPLVLICLADQAAVRGVLSAEGPAAALKGRTVVDLGTTGPEEARAAARFLEDRGARYLDAAIQAAPAQMGAPDTPILVAGPKATFEAAEAELRILGGALIWLGEAADGAAYMDLATLSYVYGAFAGFLQGARIAETMGLPVDAFGRIVQTISPSFGGFFAHEGAVIASGDFAVSESPMRISLPAVRRIADVSEDLGLDAELPRLIGGWLAEAERAGLADEELAALIKVLRARSAGPQLRAAGT
ncbi:NAD(P)-dependent oxidoreductase [Phenylobacterium terrae]|uniref:NAD(P)-dependent oxidoreductase n=1 Tax=Phenylobacterium terrae TaxID=2665495 RepID=A0ABW4MY82_9CAUL